MILLTYYSSSGQVEEVVCEAQLLGEIIDIRLPYWVSPDVVRAIENGICAGKTSGEVNAVSVEGGTTPGRYHWKIT